MAAAGAILAAYVTTPASAQHSQDNALRAATDAFGLSIGNEKIGIYTTEQVRGFSPVAAGNLRIEGLYFDLVGELSDRLIEGSTIRVGLTAQSYPFPAPTGIVDYRLRTAGARPLVSLVGGFGDYAGPYAQLDVQVPLGGERLGLAAGVGYSREEDPDATDGRFLSASAALSWRPSAGNRLIAFWSRINGSDEEASPLILVGGPYEPPHVPRRVRFAQDWTDRNFHSGVYGIAGTAALGGGWTVKAGLFRAHERDRSKFTDLFRATQPDGLAQHSIVADPPQTTGSTSGELRVTRLFQDGPRRHSFHLIARGRERRALFGGSATADFGPARIDERQKLPEPGFTFGEQTRDHVRQRTLGLGYEMSWRDVGTFNAGVQRTRYRKTVAAPNRPPAQAREQAWLFNASIALAATKRLILYGSYTRGLEETGTAPENAVNRGEPLPAARTSQRDAGLRYALTPGLKLIAGLFDVRKPYYNLDAGNVFTSLGEERHRGIELSLAGALGPRINLVAGAQLLRARVTGEAVALGRVGPKPVNTSGERVRASTEYRPPILAGLSLDVTLEYDGPRVASRDNRLILPKKAVFRLGSRYRFHLGKAPAQVRLQLENATNVYGWRLTNSGGFRVNAGRRVTGYMAVDL